MNIIIIIITHNLCVQMKETSHNMTTYENQANPMKWKRKEQQNTGMHLYLYVK